MYLLISSINSYLGGNFSYDLHSLFLSEHIPNMLLCYLKLFESATFSHFTDYFLLMWIPFFKAKDHRLTALAHFCIDNVREIHKRSTQKLFGRVFCIFFCFCQIFSGNFLEKLLSWSSQICVRNDGLTRAWVLFTSQTNSSKKLLLNHSTNKSRNGIVILK